MDEDGERTTADGDDAPDATGQHDDTRYPGHENPEALRERSGLDRHAGRDPEVSPDVAADEPGG